MAQPPYQDQHYQYPPVQDSYQQQQYQQQPQPYQQQPYQQQPYQQGTSPYPPQGSPYTAQPGYPPPPITDTPPPTGSAAAHYSGPKKRQYAPQAYDFGAGANSAITPSSSGPISAPGYPPTIPAAPIGYPSAERFTPAPIGSYVPPQPGYETPGGPVASITGQFSQMGFGSQPQTATPHLQKPYSLNPLHTIDIGQHPLNAAELDLPPPPIMLPQNASLTPSPAANCPPKYMRSTLNCVPTTYSLLKKSKLPFALIIQPYTSFHDDEDPVPLVSDTVISRCRRCRSYINPFATFFDHGTRWRCNMCNLANDTPQAFDWDHAQQKQIDRWQRAELNYAVVEFIAPQEYMVRPPQPLVYLFLFDVSYAAVSSGLLATSARTILESLDRIPNADIRTRLGFICVDSSLHYFSVPLDTQEPNMLVVSDLDEPFLPIPGDLLVPLKECREGIENLLGKLQDMFQHNQNGGSAMGSALKAAHKLISPIGGKVVVLTASLPNIGAGKLEVREDKNALGTSKESSLLQTANSFYKSFAVECSKSQVSVDMFLFSANYQDVASLSNLPRYTGGQTYFYPGWSAARAEDAMKFAREFSDYLSAEIALEAVMRVRATTGLRMSTFYGNFFNRSSDLCAFPAFPRDQGYVVEVAIDETLERQIVCMQTAVLHTTCNGERRIRVMTLALPTTQSIADVYAGADQVAITTYFSHKAVEKVLSGGGLDAARDALQAKLIELLVTYRRELSGGAVGGGLGGLQFCSNLKGLIVLFLALIKHVGLRKTVQIPTDLRSAALCLLSTLPSTLLLQYIYPRFYSLHDMSDDCGLPHPETGEIILPPPMNLSAEKLQLHGLYLIDDTQTQFLWIGGQAVPQLIQDVFGVNSIGEVKFGKTSVPIVENEFNERVRAVIEKSRDKRGKGVASITVPNLYFVRGDGEPSLRLWASSLLIEDRSDAGMSLPQWLSFLREKVSSS